MIEKIVIRNAFENLGLRGQCVCVHSSMRSFGCSVEGGVEAVIDSFLEAGCTLLSPTFDYDYEVYPPPHLRPERNGISDYSIYDERVYPEPRIFSTDSVDITKGDMGVLPYTLLRTSGRERGRHSILSFAAAGDVAAELVQGQSASAVWDPFRALCERDGFVLLMGVGLNRATILHYAEQLAGRTPFVRWANSQEGIPEVCEYGSCSEGFESFADVLKPIETGVQVGGSVWRCFPAREMVRLCVAAMKENPEMTSCGNPDCDRCRDAVLGGPVWG